MAKKSPSPKHPWRYALLAVPIICMITAIYILDLKTVSFSSAGERSGIEIGQQRFVVESVCSDAARTRGLSGRKFLASGSGMLFLFETPGFHSIWMKEMHFPIDIIWINTEHVIIHIERNISPETYPKVFRPESFAKYVLEIPAGESQKLVVSDPVKLKAAIPPQASCR